MNIEKLSFPLEEFHFASDRLRNRFIALGCTRAVSVYGKATHIETAAHEAGYKVVWIGAGNSPYTICGLIPPQRGV